MKHPAVHSVLECGYDPSLIKKAYDSLNVHSTGELKLNIAIINTGFIILLYH